MSEEEEKYDKIIKNVHVHEHELGCGWVFIVIAVCVTAFYITKLFVP